MCNSDFQKDDPGRIAQLMKAFRNGDKEAVGQLVAVFYPELRRIASRRMRSERSPHTWQPTVLINELYLELLKIRSLDDSANQSDKDAFLSLGAHIMRRLLVHHARPTRRRAEHEVISDDLIAGANGVVELAEIEELLSRLAEVDPQLRVIAEMRAFEGLSIPEIATLLNCAPRTIDRRWCFVRTWLRNQIAPAPPATDSPE